MDLRGLPSVDVLQRELARDGLPGALAMEIARQAVGRARQRMREEAATADARQIAEELAEPVRRSRPRRVINATGVLLHTNLGRAVEPAAAVALQAVATGGFTNLEFDLTTGRRGGRGRYAEQLVAALTGAGDAVIVNNNAGALMLTLAALAGGSAVVVSRGELIEIGGSFRLPDLMTASGVRLIEVGTTNRTRASDYAAVIDRASLLLKVHPSNYRISGFAEDVDWAEAAEVAKAAGVPLVADVGSGLLDERVPWIDGPPSAWLSGEPGVRQTLEKGAGLVLFSGDKLLGGPQAGLIVGEVGLIERVRRHPIARAVRIGGGALASLTVTLELYAGGRAMEIPFWRMATIPIDDVERRAQAWAAAGDGEVTDSDSVPGAGSVPGTGIPSKAAAFGGDIDSSWRRLLDQPTPVVARRAGDRLLLDPRSVDPGDDPEVAAAVETACR